MPATNYTPIQLYRSTTSGNTPLAANMSAGEIALNIADNDMSMWMENASGTVKRFFNNPAALKYPTADGTSGQVIVTDGSGNLSFATPAGGALTNNVRQAVTSSATTTLNLNSGNVIDLTMAANITTLSFTNVPASGTPILIQIVVKNASDGTAYTIVWPNSVYWSGQYAATTIATVQTAPTLATGANGVTVIALLTTDGGTKWRGWVEATIPGGSQSSLYSWGTISSGSLGQGVGSGAISSPVQIGALTNWSSFTFGLSGAFGVAIKNDGTLWSWGNNTSGQLGQNSYTVSLSSPVQVGALTNWSKIVGGVNHCLAIKTDGTLWSWGGNSSGALGQNQGAGNNRSSPTQIGALTTWSSVAASRYASFAIKTDGTLWSWGGNDSGVLGLNAGPNVSSPTQIGALTTWSKLGGSRFACFAIKTDGTLWGWGDGSTGQLGQNSTTIFSSPVQVGALTDWARVATQGYNSCIAVKTDGTLWAWGQNTNGILGLNNTASVSSPTQVGALTNWAQTERFAAQSRNSSTLAVKTDGTLWGWGGNASGQLGLNTTTNFSSPVQIGALTSWSAVTAGFYCSGALSTLVINPA